MRLKAHLDIHEDEADDDDDGESIVNNDDIDAGADDDIIDGNANEVNRALPVNSLICWMADIGNLHIKHTMFICFNLLCSILACSIIIIVKMFF